MVELAIHVALRTLCPRGLQVRILSGVRSNLCRYGEMADARGLNPLGRDTVPVRVRLPVRVLKIYETSDSTERRSRTGMHTES